MVRLTLYLVSVASLSTGVLVVSIVTEVLISDETGCRSWKCPPVMIKQQSINTTTISYLPKFPATIL